MIIISRTKFNVDKKFEDRTYNGIVFDSKMEMQYYRDILCPLENSGDVTSIELQKSYELQPKFQHDGRTVQPIRYVSDFYVVYADGHEEVIDIKGYPEPTALLKRKMFWYHYPTVNYRWITYIKKYGGWVDYEECKKLRAADKQAKKELKENENGKSEEECDDSDSQQCN